MKKKLDWPLLVGVVAAAVAVGLLLKWKFGGDWFEFAGFVTGVVGVYLAARESIVNWPVGIANVLIYAYVFFQARLYADMTLQFFFCVLSVAGWIQWARGGENATELRITKLDPKGWALLTLAWVVGTAVYTPIITYFKGAAPFVDSLLTVGSVIAQVLLNGKKIENWILWIAIDLVYIPLYVSRQLVATAVLYGLFLVLAVVGLVGWIKAYRAESH